MTENTSLDGKIRKWIETQGYPLEMTVANAFREVGFQEVTQSEYYKDLKNNSDILPLIDRFEAYYSFLENTGDEFLINRCWYSSCGHYHEEA